MSIPLIQETTKDAINTSIIAIKRNIERINMLLGLVDSGSPDLSGLATKQELEDAITLVETDLAPVDEVTSGNMQSVTSNAVAQAISNLGWSYTEIDTGKKWLGGEKIYKMCFEQAVTGATFAGNIIQLSFLPNVIVSLSGLIHSSSFCFPLGQWNSNTLFSYITFNRSTRRLYAEVNVSGASIQAFNIYIEMEYCK